MSDKLNDLETALKSIEERMHRLERIILEQALEALGMTEAEMRRELMHVVPKEEERPASCKWVRDCTEDGDCHWETACGTGWCTTWNTPKEDNYNYCPSCGGKVEFTEEKKP